MSRVEGSEHIINATHDPGIDSDGVNASMEASACLFDILAQHVEGEALVIIKSVTDYHGFEAWRRLHRKYSPRTMARRLRLITYGGCEPREDKEHRRNSGQHEYVGGAHYTAGDPISGVSYI